MHKSRLAGFIIDCKTDDLEAATAFWRQALGYKVDSSANPPEAIYRTFDTGPSDLHIEVQKVSHPSRVHLDIETDDIEAEVQRLEKLGAKRVEQIRTWWHLVGHGSPHRPALLRRAPAARGFRGECACLGLTTSLPQNSRDHDRLRL